MRLSGKKILGGIGIASFLGLTFYSMGKIANPPAKKEPATVKETQPKQIVKQPTTAQQLIDKAFSLEFILENNSDKYVGHNFKIVHKPYSDLFNRKYGPVVIISHGQYEDPENIFVKQQLLPFDDPLFSGYNVQYLQPQSVEILEARFYQVVKEPYVPYFKRGKLLGILKGKAVRKP